MRAPTMIGLGVLALAVTASCYREYQPAAPMYPPQPMVVYGPPGGGMDPVDAHYAGAAGYAEPAVAPAIEPSADPQDPGYVMGTVTDAEIDATLEPYGEWVVVEDYGRVWRPHATVVGVDFTPYETCGSWVWTDYGWTYACDWDWGWLPFHYGQWAYLDWGWGWVPDYTWSPAWVDWRYGNGYVGWRPSRPRIVDHRDGHRGDRVRDHRRADRGAPTGPRIRDHRGRSGDADWRFTHERDFGRGRIRGKLTRNPAEGLRVTSTVARPPVRTSTPPIRAAGLMRARLGAKYGASRAWAPSRTGGRPAVDRPTRPTRPGFHQPSRGAYAPSRGTYAPSRGTYAPSRGTYAPSRGTYAPSRGTYAPSRGTYAPSRGTYAPSRGTYAPARGTYAPSRGTYAPASRPRYAPSRSSAPPSRPSAPSRGTYAPPSRSSAPSRGTYAPPSRSSAPSRGTYAPPSRPSSSRGNSGSRWGGSSSSSGSSHRASPPSRGGGRRR